MKNSRTALAYSVYVISSSLYAGTLQVESKQTQQPYLTTLVPIIVEAKKEEKVGQKIYDKEVLEQIPNSNKTITDFLKVNPNVQFSNSAAAGGKQGEIASAEISINGGLVYDNKIMLDNVRLNNLINPAGGNTDYGQSSMSGTSIATTVNTDLICELEVLDSNLSAEYGEFTGGVVKAKTCAPKTAIGEIHGQISYDYTSSAWTSFSKVSEEELQDYDKTNTTYQKEFEKQGLSALLYGRLNENVGLSLAVAKRWSDIDILSDLSTGQDANQKRENDNINLNIYAKLTDLHQLKVGFQFQDDQKDLQQVHVLNSQKKVNSENKALDLTLDSKFAYANVSQSLVYQNQKMLNDSSSDELVPWKPSPNKNWVNTASTLSEGSYGDQAQHLNSLEYNLKSEFIPFRFLATQHQLVAGFGYGHYEADWERLGRVYGYFVPSGNGLKGTDCLNALGKVDAHCDISYNDGVGQFHVQRDVLEAGKIEVRQDRAHVFVEDRMNWNNTFKATLGLRTDYDSLSKQTNIAPRTSFVYQPFQDSRLNFTAGWNRYYANNAFSYQLQDGINTLITREKRASVKEDWAFSSNSNSANVQRSQLATPYADETVFAINSRLGWFDNQLKYVKRNNQDQVRKQRISMSPLIDDYDNYGKSTADIYTFSISNFTPIALWSTQNRFQLSADYTETVRNFNDYDDEAYNPLTYKQYILYDKHIIDEANRPADNFARPWSLRLGWDMKMDNLPVSVSHFFRYRSPYDAMVSSGIAKAEQPIGPDGEAVTKQYEAMKIGSAFTWDIRTTYSLPIGKNNQLILGLTVNNVTNRLNTYKSTAVSSILYSEPGRQFIADLSFKF